MTFGFMRSLASLIRVPSLLKLYASNTLVIHVNSFSGVLKEENFIRTQIENQLLYQMIFVFHGPCH